MNIFHLDRHPRACAQLSVDAHIRSGIMEVSQLIGFCYPDGEFEPWKWLRHSDRHFKHPMARWVRENNQNLNWALNHLGFLLGEYSVRFGKKHACSSIYEWIINHPVTVTEGNYTAPPLCFGKFKEQCFDEDYVVAYRKYYNAAKRHLFKWTKRPVPIWIDGR